MFAGSGGGTTQPAPGRGSSSRSVIRSASPVQWKPARPKRNRRGRCARRGRDRRSPSSKTASRGGTPDAQRAGATVAAIPSTDAATATSITPPIGTEKVVTPSDASEATPRRAPITPSSSPTRVPITASATPSPRTIRITWRRDAPLARSSPNSRRRSPTDSSSVFTTPIRACTKVNSSIHSTTRWNPVSTSERRSTNAAGFSTELTPDCLATSRTAARAAASFGDSDTSAAMSVVAGTWRVSTERSRAKSPRRRSPEV